MQNHQQARVIWWFIQRLVWTQAGSSKGWSGLRLAKQGGQKTASGPPKRAVSRASRENTSEGRGKSR
ncbi:hypothetical protein E2C01_045189 [Portunus trituberculatus]|uniref:Uncharacterized protein n=1 Tax=Portunus trituberculatus TaxID=210409 RepID=A0A5B7G1B1_PORTR|nr:hypothetical protein [Portunus trituberculatus]